MWVSVAAVLVTATVLWFALGSKSNSNPVGTALVTRGNLVISITEAGDLLAKKQKVIRNELVWPVIIKKVVKEGSRVKEGEVIIEFECKELMESIEKQKLTVAQAEADYEDAKQNLELKRKEMEVKLLNAEQQEINAEADLLRYKEGQMDILKAEAEGDIELAGQELKLAQGKLKFKLEVNEDPELKSPYSKSEIEADQLAVARLKKALKSAESSFEMLKKYDIPGDLRKLKVALANAKMNQVRAKHDAEKEIRRAATFERTRSQALRMHKDRLVELEQQAAMLVIKAETEGLVVYYKPRHWRQTAVNVDVGEKINPRQQLMTIPDMTTLYVETKVYESRYQEVHPGIKAYIRLGANREIIYEGSVASVAAVATDQHWTMPGVRVVGVEVKFDKLPRDVKPGSTAQVQMTLAVLKDVLQVPVAAIFTEQEETYCWVLNGEKPEKKKVVVGRMSDTHVEIKSGLEEDQEVLPNPRRGEGLARRREPGAAARRDASTDVDDSP